MVSAVLGIMSTSVCSDVRMTSVSMGVGDAVEDKVCSCWSSEARNT